MFSHPFLQVENKKLKILRHLAAKKHITSNGAFKGFQGAIPEFIKKTVVEQKKLKSVDLRKHYLHAAKSMIKTAVSSSQRDVELRNLHPNPEVYEVLKRKNFGFCEAMAAQAGHADKDLFLEAAQGFAMTGTISETKVWPKLPPEHRLCNPHNKGKDFTKVPIKLRGQWDEPSWMGTADIKRIWDEFSENCEKMRYTEVMAENLGAMPAYAFGVNQGNYDYLTETGEILDIGSSADLSSFFRSLTKYFEKCRMCIDFRHLNSHMVCLEKLTLLGNQVIVRIVELFLSRSLELPYSHLQYKSETVKEFEINRSLASIITDEAVNGILAQNFEATLPASDNWSKLVSFWKIDLKSFYNQFCTKDKAQNSFGIFDPTRGWRYYESVVMLFGSLSSVYNCCRMSEAVQHIFNIILKICCIVYIDDICAIIPADKRIDKEHLRTAELSQYLARLFLLLAGFDISEKKVELQTEVQRCITILGVGYTISADGDSLLISPRTQKFDKTVADIRDILDKFKMGQFVLSEVQKFVGVVQWFSYFRTSRRGYCFCKALHRFTVEEKFEERIKSQQAQHVMVFLATMALMFVLASKPVVLNKAAMQRKLVHVFTDAAKTASRAVLGGVFFDDDQAIAFTLNVMRSEIPKALRRNFTWDSMGLWESLANNLSIRNFGARLRDKIAHFHIDNSESLFNSVGGGSKNIFSNCVIADNSKLQDELNLASWISYVNTGLNNADATTRYPLMDMFRKIFNPIMIKSQKVDFSIFDIQKQLTTTGLVIDDQIHQIQKSLIPWLNSNKVQDKKEQDEKSKRRKLQKSCNTPI